MPQNLRGVAFAEYNHWTEYSWITSMLASFRVARIPLQRTLVD